MIPFIFYSSLSSLLLLLSFYGWGFCAYGALIPLILIWDSAKKTKTIFLFSWLSGSLFYLSALYWIAGVSLFGWVTLCLYQGLYFGFASYFYRILRCKNSLLVLVVGSSIWISFEYIRGLGPYGFPWLYLGASQVHYLNIIQMASVGGIYIVSLLPLIVNFAGAMLFRSDHSKKMRSILILIPALMLSVFWIFGSYRLQQVISVDNGLRVALIQPNIKQENKWDPQLEKEHLQKLFDLSIDVSHQTVDLIVWPETSLQDNYKTDQYLQDKLMQLAKESNAYLIVGGNDETGSGDYRLYNSAFLIHPEGYLLDQYNKNHLVPYGEYAPFRSIFPRMSNLTFGEVDFNPGDQLRLFQVRQHSIGILICFEDIFPQMIRRVKALGARFIVNITNDAWFKRSIALSWHIEHSALAAVANGLAIVQSANTGSTCVISPRGAIMNKIDALKEGYLAENVNFIPIGTLYDKIGDSFPHFCIGIVILFLVRIRRKGVS